MPLIGMFVFLVIFCGVIIFAMYRILGKQASQAADRFSTLTEDFENKKAELKKMTQEAEARVEKMTTSAQLECDQMRAKALEELEQTRLTQVREARQEAERIVGDALKARDAMRQELAQEMHGKMIDSACELVLKVLPEPLKRVWHDHWVQDLLANGLKALNQFESREEVKTLSVESAFPLTEAQRSQIESAIQKKIRLAVPLQETVHPELIAGLRVHLGHLVLEGTLLSKLKEAARDVRNSHA